MKVKPPCFDEKTRTDCQDRCVGCRGTCERWKAWSAIHAAEMAKIAEQKHRYSVYKEYTDKQIKKQDRGKSIRRDGQR